MTPRAKMGAAWPSRLSWTDHAGRRLDPTAFGMLPARAARRRAKAVQREAEPRLTRRQRLALLRESQPGATKSDLRALLHEQARQRRRVAAAVAGRAA